MEQEGEEEEAVADYSQGLAIHPAWRFWCMLDCEQIWVFSPEQLC